MSRDGKKFQVFIAGSNFEDITPEVLASFATHLFHSKGKVSPATVTNAMVAVRDPISFGFGVEIDRREWDLLKASFFLQRPPTTAAQPNWSLSKVLDLLQSDKFQVNPSINDLFLRALFLIALATGHRVSQLAALLRCPEFTKFGPELSSVTLATRPSFLAKNERPDHRFSPVIVPAWTVEGEPHPLCPVRALSSYLDASITPNSQALWLNPQSGRPLKTAELAKCLVSLIHMADPTSEPKAHQVRKYASSLAFFRCFDVESVRKAGQWSSSTSFVTRYLVPHLSDSQCVAMFSCPPSSSRRKGGPVLRTS